MIINAEKLANVCAEAADLLHYITGILGADVVVTSGGRTVADNERVYKQKFGSGWAQYITKDSPHLFIPGQTLALAVDFTVRDVHVCKVVTALFNSKFKFTGLGIDIFKNYIHVDFKDRGLPKPKQWAYDYNGQIHYLN